MEDEIATEPNAILEWLFAGGVIAFAAFCVWLAVRIFNRGGKRSKRALAAALIMLPLIYVATFGLWCRANRTGPGEIRAAAGLAWPYQAMWWLMDNGPGPVKTAIRGYVIWCLH